MQNDHITSRTGATVVIPLRANARLVEIMAPLIDVPGHGLFVLSADAVFAIDVTRLKVPIGMLSFADWAKTKPAVDKVIGDYSSGNPQLKPI